MSHLLTARERGEMTPRDPYRVVQWTTGNVGKSSVAAIAKNPTLELVGCYAWSPEKAGTDVGELCGIEPLGVAATNDVDALLALKPDVGQLEFNLTLVIAGLERIAATTRRDA